MVSCGQRPDADIPVTCADPDPRLTGVPVPQADRHHIASGWPMVLGSQRTLGFLHHQAAVLRDGEALGPEKRCGQISLAWRLNGYQPPVVY